MNNEIPASFSACGDFCVILQHRYIATIVLGSHIREFAIVFIGRLIIFIAMENEEKACSEQQIEKLYEIFLRHPEVSTDSRDCPAGAIFFALKGDKFNGNKYAAMALEQGCSCAVVDEAEYAIAGDDRYFLVPDALTALQQLAHHHREQFNIPVLQITGTNGKTTTKELVSAVLARKHNVLSTQGNFNNHIGVPKTLLRLRPEHAIAVIETGANHPGEIRTLAEIVDPTAGLITNVGVAHIEGFGSFEGVVKTKGELFDYMRHNSRGFVFLNADNPHLVRISKGLLPVTYGQPGKGYFIEGEVVDCSPYLRLRWRKGNMCMWEDPWHEVQTHLVGAYNLTNCLAAACVGNRYGVDVDDISKALQDYCPTNNRSELTRTATNMLVIDAYNANPSSMNAALDNFALMTPPDNMTKMLILGDMKELGAISEQEHRRILDKLTALNFSDVWLVGNNFASLNPPFPTFQNVDEVKARLRETPVNNRLILIKGSNSTRLFELPQLL